MWRREPGVPVLCLFSGSWLQRQHESNFHTGIFSLYNPSTGGPSRIDSNDNMSDFPKDIHPEPSNADVNTRACLFRRMDRNVLVKAAAPNPLARRVP